jgi:flagellar basal-body rod modification protein FlgD
MTVNSTTSTNSTTGTGSSTDTTMNSATGGKTLGVDDFLKLLSVQMQAQDPMQPMQDTEFIAQMASFTSLQQMKTLTGSMNNYATANYLGKTVTVNDSSAAAGYVTGTVDNVKFTTGGNPQLVIGGKTYATTDILNVQNTPTTSGTNTAATTSTNTASNSSN